MTSSTHINQGSSYSAPPLGQNDKELAVQLYRQGVTKVHAIDPKMFSQLRKSHINWMDGSQKLDEIKETFKKSLICYEKAGQQNDILAQHIIKYLKCELLIEEGVKFQEASNWRQAIQCFNQAERSYSGEHILKTWAIFQLFKVYKATNDHVAKAVYQARYQFFCTANASDRPFDMEQGIAGDAGRFYPIYEAKYLRKAFYAEFSKSSIPVAIAYGIKFHESYVKITNSLTKENLKIIFGRMNVHESSGDFWNDLGLLYLVSHAHVEADHCFVNAKQYYDRINEPRKEHLMVKIEINRYFASGKNPEDVSKVLSYLINEQNFNDDYVLDVANTILELGDSYLQLGDYDKAFYTAEMTIKVYDRYRSWAGDYQEDAEGILTINWKDYINSLSKKITNYDFRKDKVLDADAWILKGKIAQQKGGDEEALQCFQEGLKRYKFMAKKSLIYWKGESKKIKDKDEKDAFDREHIRQPTNLQEKVAYAQSLIGNVLMDLKRIQEAYSIFERALKIYSKFEDVPNFTNNTLNTIRVGLQKCLILILQDEHAYFKQAEEFYQNKQFLKALESANYAIVSLETRKQSSRSLSPVVPSSFIQSSIPLSSSSTRQSPMSLGLSEVQQFARDLLYSRAYKHEQDCYYILCANAYDQLARELYSQNELDQAEAYWRAALDFYRSISHLRIEVKQVIKGFEDHFSRAPQDQAQLCLPVFELPKIRLWPSIKSLSI